MSVVFLLEEALGAAGLARVPTELRSASHVIGLLAVNQSIPCFVDQWLMEKAIDYTGVHPVTLGQSRFEVAGNVLNMTFSRGVESRAKAASPVFALSEKLDNFLRVRACSTAVALLVMLVERVRTPEAPIAARLWTRILPPAFMEFILVALPIVLALEARLT